MHWSTSKILTTKQLPIKLIIIYFKTNKINKQHIFLVVRLGAIQLGINISRGSLIVTNIVGRICAKFAIFDDTGGGF